MKINKEICILRKNNFNEEKKLIELRSKVNELYFQYNLKRAQIIKKEGMSKPFIYKWTQLPHQDFERDYRGWRKGKVKVYDDLIKEKVHDLHKQLS